MLATPVAVTAAAASSSSRIGRTQDNENSGNGGMKNNDSDSCIREDHSADAASAALAHVAVASQETSLLFSCRCESAKAVSTLLSCLRHFGSGGGARDGGTWSSTQTTARGRDLSMSADLPLSRNGGRGGGGTSAKTQLATVYASPGALTFHVHGLAKQSQASVDMQVSGGCADADVMLCICLLEL